MKLETKRLIIRPFTLDDLPEFRKLLTIEELPGWVMQQNRAEDFLKWQISNYEKMDIINGTVCFGIFDKTDGHILGNVGAGEHDDLHEPEIFYCLLASERGHGFAAEAAAAVTEWVFANYDMPYLIGTVAEDNPASQRVLEKCGYKYVDTRTLKVHIMEESYSFRYYRHYSNSVRLVPEL
ncbi:MAG: GNAT family N-acetyltransferase [Clostridia bacterium]|nr:GNAT family N-acetyltransferase [Clostridia bacterium]